MWCNTKGIVKQNFSRAFNFFSVKNNSKSTKLTAQFYLLAKQTVKNNQENKKTAKKT
jgi:hypothetical protein